MSPVPPLPSQKPAVARLAPAAAAASAGLGVLVLVGHALDLERLTHVTPSLPDMKAATAAGFVAVGLSLWLLHNHPVPPLRLHAGRALGLSVALLAALSLAATAMLGDASGDPPSRPSPHTALAFLAIGLWLASIDMRRREGPVAEATLGAAACVTVLLAAYGYLLDVDYLRGASSVHGMAVHTLAGLAVVCVGVLAARPERGIMRLLSSPGPGGVVVRRMVPFMLVVSALFAILGVAGAEAGLYDMRQGVALLAPALALIGIAAVAYVAAGLERAHAERGRAEERALTQAEERVRAILETTHDLVVRVDLEGRFTQVNGVGTHVLGYEPEEMVGRSFADFIQPEDLEEARSALALVLTGTPVRDREVPFRAKDGSRVVLEWNARPVRDVSGAIVGGIGTGSDVTARSRAQAEQRTTAERLQAILDNTPDVIFVKDTDGRYTLVNRAFASTVRRNSADIIGLTDLDLFPADVAEPLRATDREALASAHGIRREERVTSSDGAERFFSTVKFPLRDAEGAPVAVCGVAADITDAKRAEAGLRDQLERSAALAALGASALVGAPSRELIAAAVEQVTQLLGADVAVLVELSEDGAYFLRRATHAKAGSVPLPDRIPTDRLPAIKAALDAGEPVFIDDRHADPRVPPDVAALSPDTSSLTVPIKQATGFRGVLAAMSISKRGFTPQDADFLVGFANVIGLTINREEALAALEKRTEELAEVAAARGRLVAEALAAEARERARLGEALHDDALQSLLAVRQDLAAAEDAAVQDPAVARARETLEDTLRAVRELVASVHPVTLSHAGLTTALESVAGLHARRAGFEAAVTVTCAPGEVDEQLVLGLARELLANAEKHARASHVWVRLACDDGEAVLEVQDDGAGMERFDPVAAVRSGHIGLASSSERVRALGGSLDVKSEPGAGTRVRVTLPIGVR